MRRLSESEPLRRLNGAGLHPAIDTAIVASLAGLAFTRATVIFFHLMFLAVVVASMRLSLREYVIRACLVLLCASFGLLSAVHDGRASAEELWELPLMSLFLVSSYGLRWQREQAQRSIDAARFRVMAGVAHDIRNPLTAAKGFAQIIQLDQVHLSREELMEMAQAIAQAATEATEMIDDLLAASLIQAEVLRVDAKPFDLIEVVTDLVAQHAEATESMRLVIAGEMTRLPVVGDPLRIRQIVRNLLTNAVRYGGPNVDIRLSCDGTTGCVEVMDDGRGIAPSERERVFEPFTQGTTNRRPAESVGLGLYTSRKLATLMGGHLTYRFDGRSVFTMGLPLTHDAGSIPACSAAAHPDIRAHLAPA